MNIDSKSPGLVSVDVNEDEARRIDAMKMAELIYDMYVEDQNTYHKTEAVTDITFII